MTKPIQSNPNANRDPAMEERPLGVVIERRNIDNPWIDYEWRPVAVVDDGPGAPGWRDLEEGDGWKRYLVTGFKVSLYSGETEGYKVNLSQPQPFVYVVLRPGEEREDHDVEPFALTVCPYEAMRYAESGDEIVEGVAMPSGVEAWVASFTDKYHVEQPFKKRKRDRGYGDDIIGTRPRGRFSS
ncbi:MAG: DUF3305 domain-containing protein [Rhodospirillales bacterium]